MFYATAIQLPDVSFAITQDNEVTHRYGLTYDVVFLLQKVFYIIHILSLIDTALFGVRALKTRAFVFMSVDIFGLH